MANGQTSRRTAHKVARGVRTKKVWMCRWIGCTKLAQTGCNSFCKAHNKESLKMEMMQKMGTPAPYGGFPLTNPKFKTWLQLKMLINTETPLTNINCPPPVDCNGWEIDMFAFPIQ